MAKKAHARNGTSAARMAHAVGLASQAEKLAMKAIVEGAREVMAASSLASEYVQAMGSWAFTVIIPFAPEEGQEDNPERFYEDEIGDSSDDLRFMQNFAEDFRPEYRAHIEPFIKALGEFRKLHQAYKDAFGNTAAGESMRFGLTGPIVTNW